MKAYNNLSELPIILKNGYYLYKSLETNLYSKFKELLRKCFLLSLNFGNISELFCQYINKFLQTAQFLFLDAINFKVSSNMCNKLYVK